MKKKHLFEWFCLTIFILGAVFIYSFQLTGSSSKMVNIEPGMATKQIAKILKNNGIIKSEILFSLLAEIFKLDGELKSGRYKIDSYLNIFQILNKLKRGEVEENKIIIPEGYTNQQIASYLSSQGLVDKKIFIALTKNKKFCQELNIPAYQLEGYLFPDTYFIDKSTTEKEIIEKMVKRFKQMIKEGELKRAQNLQLSIYEVIILASLIEKEAQKKEEKFLISAVFHNRLKKRMPLCSCATVRYFLNKYKTPLTFVDTRVNSKYNTYIYRGLPPGPIANPGKEAIKAALYPMEVNFLYFVSKGNGTHKFSSTLAEHLKAKDKYEQIKDEKF